MRCGWTLVMLLGARCAWGAEIDFGRDIQPILAEHCFQCHGPDAQQRQADLRLDSRESALTQGAIQPGRPGDSELVRRIFSEDADVVMPPPATLKKLTAAEKQLLRDWIEQGAVYAEHWAFVPPVRPPIPRVQGVFAANPIDAFIVARLQREGLTPAPPADPLKLLRRVTLDLTGLPPTLEELEAFTADIEAAGEPFDQAVERAYLAAVDRLLHSPRYGERMVWEWLDAARYADTNGYQGDPTRPMWYWRDWALAAFNDNLPFDRFTREQLAGDLLPNPTTEQLIATGFHRNHMINGEGGRIAEESRVEYVQDRVETTGTVWMGLTLTCCRCHNHKYDPFTQKEYYQLAAYFNSIDESGANDAGGLAHPLLVFPTPEQQARIDRQKAEEQRLAAEQAELERQLRLRQREWEAELLHGGHLSAGPDWTVLTPKELRAEHGTQLVPQPDGSILAAGPSPDKDEYVLTFEPDLPELTGLRLEVLPADGFTNRGPGRAPENGNFVLSEWTLSVNGRSAAIAFARVDYAQSGWPGEAAFDGKLDTGWAIASEFGQPHELVAEIKQPTPGRKNMVMRLSFHYGGQHTLGRFRVSATTDPPSRFRPLPEKIRQLLARPADERSPDEQRQLAQYYLETQPAWSEAKRLRDEARRKREEAERAARRTMILRDRPQPRVTTVLIKGAYNAPGEPVEHGVLSGLAPLPDNAPRNRLALADWLLSPQHPLTARVTVNRLWQQFFGTGLVKTAEDFGLQGERPSHPELLDWLAIEFRESGWDVKRLVRLMVSSATYRQATTVTPAHWERDPANRLLARGPRHRWPSWMIRDQALAVSGLLVEQLGGPPVKGYQPEGIWEEATFGQIRYEQDHGAALYRRSLYTFWRRIVAPTVFFDVANRQNCTVRLERTNTPLHALITLNDVTYVEAARALAQRTLHSEKATDDAARLVELFRRCTARVPRPSERERLLARLATLRTVYAEDPSAAGKLITIGESAPEASVPPQELAAWTAIASLVLNLDEVLSKD
jgi:hypothetical protein